MQRREAEGRVQSNRYFRAGLNTLLHFGEVHYKGSRWFFQVFVTSVKTKFDDANISALASFMGR